MRLTAEADIRGLAFAEKGGTARDTLELLLLVAPRGHRRVHALRPAVRDGLPEGDARALRARLVPDHPRAARSPPGPPGEDRGPRQERRAVGSLTHDVRGARLGRPPRVEPGPERPPPRGRGPGGGPAGADRPAHVRAVGSCSTAPSRSTVRRATRRPGAPNVTAGFAIRRSDGRVLAAAPETPLRPGPDGSLTRSLGVPLDGAPPGALRGDRRSSPTSWRAGWRRRGSRS